MGQSGVNIHYDIINMPLQYIEFLSRKNEKKFIGKVLICLLKILIVGIRLNRLGIYSTKFKTPPIPCDFSSQCLVTRATAY